MGDITRSQLLRGGLALLGASAAAPLLARPGLAQLARSGGPQAEPSLLELKFAQIARLRPFDLLPQPFKQLDARFAGPEPEAPFDVLSPGVSAEPARTVGGLRLVPSRKGPVWLRSEAGPVAPCCTVIVTAEQLGAGPGKAATLLAGLVGDAQTFVAARFEAADDPAAGTVAIEVSVNGRSTRAASVGADLAGASRFAFAVNENYATALVSNGAAWRPVVQHRIADLLDLRQPDTLRRLRFGFGTAGSGSGFTVTRVEAGPFGQAGLRDLHVVSTADGKPLIRDGKLFFTATQAGLAFVQAAHWGVWTLDLDRPDRLEPVAALFFARDGLLLGDHAGQIVADERDGGFHLAVSSWGDFDYAGVHVRYLRTFADILSGVHVLETEPMPLPTEESSWDPAMVRIDDRWHVAFTESPIQEPGNFRFHPALARGAPGAPPTETSRVGADLSLGQTEGTILQKVGGEWFVLAGDGEARRYRAYDLRMKPVGTLKAPFGSNIPHPQIVPAPENGRTAYLLVTFDGTPFHEEVLGYGTHGDMIVMRAAQTRQGHEFSP